MIVATADVHYTKTRRKKIEREKEKLRNAIAFIVAGDITVKGSFNDAKEKKKLEISCLSSSYLEG